MKGYAIVLGAAAAITLLSGCVYDPYYYGDGYGYRGGYGYASGYDGYRGPYARGYRGYNRDRYRYRNRYYR